MSNQPYLQIRLDKMDDVPVVIFKGEEIKLKREVLLHWETDTDEYGGTTVKIEHFDTNNIVVQKRIEETTKNHMNNSPIRPNS